MAQSNNQSRALKSEYVFFAGERVARRDLPAGSVSYYFSDNLKTADLITDSAGAIKSESDYCPFGGELPLINNDSNHYKHNGKERDAETGLDYYGARHYSPSLSRFITPDWSSVPVPVPYADLTNPQTLNQYIFAHNNPTTLGDPDGHESPMINDPKAMKEFGDNFSRNLERVIGAGKAFGRWLTSGQPPHIMTPAQTPPTNCVCPAPQQNSRDTKDKNNSNQNSNQEQSGQESQQGNQGSNTTTYADSKFAQQLDKQAAKDGIKSIEKSVKSLEKRLVEHQAKLQNSQYKTSVEREIKTFQKQIDTAKQYLKEHGGQK